MEIEFNKEKKLILIYDSEDNNIYYAKIRYDSYRMMTDDNFFKCLVKQLLNDKKRKLLNIPKDGLLNIPKDGLLNNHIDLLINIECDGKIMSTTTMRNMMMLNEFMNKNNCEWMDNPINKAHEKNKLKLAMYKKRI